MTGGWAHPLRSAFSAASASGVSTSTSTRSSPQIQLAHVRRALSAVAPRRDPRRAERSPGASRRARSTGLPRRPSWTGTIAAGVRRLLVGADQRIENVRARPSVGIVRPGTRRPGRGLRAARRSRRGERGGQGPAHRPGSPRSPAAAQRPPRPRTRLPPRRPRTTITGFGRRRGPPPSAHRAHHGLPFELGENFGAPRSAGRAPRRAQRGRPLTARPSTRLSSLSSSLQLVIGPSGPALRLRRRGDMGAAEDDSNQRPRRPTHDVGARHRQAGEGGTGAPSRSRFLGRASRSPGAADHRPVRGIFAERAGDFQVGRAAESGQTRPCPDLSPDRERDDVWPPRPRIFGRGKRPGGGGRKTTISFPRRPRRAPPTPRRAPARAMGGVARPSEHPPRAAGASGSRARPQGLVDDRRLSATAASVETPRPEQRGCTGATRSTRPSPASPASRAKGARPQTAIRDDLHRRQPSSPSTDTASRPAGSRW